MWEEKVRDSHTLGISSTGSRPCGILVDILQESFLLSALCILQILENGHKWGVSLFYLELEHFIKFRAQTKPRKEGDLWGSPQGKDCTSHINMVWKSTLLKLTCERNSLIPDTQYLLCYSEQAVTEAFVNSRAWPSLDGSLHNLSFSSDLSSQAFKSIFCLWVVEPPGSSWVVWLWLNARWKTWHQLLVSNRNT